MNKEPEYCLYYFEGKFLLRLSNAEFNNQLTITEPTFSGQSFYNNHDNKID